MGKKSVLKCALFRPACNAHSMCRPAATESRHHGVAAKAAQVVGGPSLLRAVDRPHQFYFSSAADDFFLGSHQNLYPHQQGTRLAADQLSSLVFEFKRD